MKCKKCGKSVKSTVRCPQFPGQVICTGCCMSCSALIGKGTSVLHCGFIPVSEAVDDE